eukprot:1002160-Prorocentrum_minimum.AAC.1
MGGQGGQPGGKLVQSFRRKTGTVLQKGEQTILTFSASPVSSGCRLIAGSSDTPSVSRAPSAVVRPPDGVPAAPQFGMPFSLDESPEATEAVPKNPRFSAVSSFVRWEECQDATIPRQTVYPRHHWVDVFPDPDIESHHFGSDSRIPTSDERYENEFSNCSSRPAVLQERNSVFAKWRSIHRSYQVAIASSHGRGVIKRICEISQSGLSPIPKVREFAVLSLWYGRPSPLWIDLSWKLYLTRMIFF